MSEWKRAVVLIDDLDAPEQLLDKAARLAATSDLEVHVMAVVFEEIATAQEVGTEVGDQLKIFALQVAHDALDDLVDRYRERFRHVEAQAIWNPTPWQGAIDAARAFDADVIIRRAHVESRLKEILHTPDDWNLMRHSHIPVMLIQQQPFSEHPPVLAAVDVRDTEHRRQNVNIVRQAGELARRLGGTVTVISAYPMFMPLGAVQDAAFDYSALRNDMIRQMQQTLADLIEEAALEVEVTYEAVEGAAEAVIAERAKSLGAEMVVVGTAGRESLSALVIGNTSERVIHHTKADLMVVPLSNRRH